MNTPIVTVGQPFILSFIVVTNRYEQVQKAIRIMNLRESKMEDYPGNTNFVQFEVPVSCIEDAAYLTGVVKAIIQK